MTPKEKAKELFDKMNFSHPEHEKYVAKECALIAVDEIIQAIDFDWMEVQNLDREHNYWQQVKAEIELL